MAGLFIAADTASLAQGASQLASAMGHLPMGGQPPSLGHADADAAFGEVARAFARHSQMLADAAEEGARSLGGFVVGYQQAGG